MASTPFSALVRSGFPYWQDIFPKAERPALPRLVGTERCEIAIIGGGITGALIARALVDAGVDTVLLESGEIGNGSTAASTGLLQWTLDIPFTRLRETRGEGCAALAYRAGRSALARLEQICERLPSAVGFEKRSSLYIASAPEDSALIEAECDALRRIGLPVSMLGSEELEERFGVSGHSALVTEGDAAIDPYRFTLELVQDTRAGGLRAFEHSEMLGRSRRGAWNRLSTEHGEVECRAIVFAVGYDSAAYVSRISETLATTYVIATHPLERSPAVAECLLWETARPYFYLRSLPGGRLLLGGADSESARDHLDEERLLECGTEVLLRAASLLPGTELRPAYLWAGTFGSSPDSLPLIGAPDGDLTRLMAVGLGGNGITFSAIAAELIVKLVRNEPSELIELFGWQRGRGSSTRAASGRRLPCRKDSMPPCGVRSRTAATRQRYRRSPP